MQLPKPHLSPKSWKSTIYLPKSTFPPRALAEKHRKDSLKKCTDDIYAWQQKQQGRRTFTLLDGPPYANGKLHLGHALNKILKDITCRFQLSQGRRVDWTPGWDCHGLPIELKALEQLKEQASVPRGNSTSSSNGDALVIRRAARKLATKTIEEQKKAFRGWGLMADWDNPWKTMDKSFEIKQLEVFGQLVNRGLIYRQRRPVYWSPSSRTALAEAELEYRDDHLSTAAFVRYELQNAPERFRVGLAAEAPVSVMIWTTTPWTLPANRAIGVHMDLKYILVDSQTHGRFIIADSRAEELRKQTNTEYTVVAIVNGSDLLGLGYRDRVFEADSSSLRPILHADFVSADSGTGLVHIAPGHGAEDYELGVQHGIAAFAPVDDAGTFTALASPKDPAMLEGRDILTDGTKIVLRILADSNNLVAQHEYRHKYPYDWRSKQPVVVRATEQWFAHLGGLQTNVLDALDTVKFFPEGGKKRLQSFVKNRKEWCISRQRAWGVPIPALYNKATGEAILTEESVSHIRSIISERGSDAWWSDSEFDPAWIPPSLRNQDGQSIFIRGKDTMDVWFDSGTCWTQAKTPDHIADVYLEGTDQHRGWFQSSLITFAASQGKKLSVQAPFRTLVTHGFTLDENGRKMSKSIGNVVSPEEIVQGNLLPPTMKKINGSMTQVREAMGIDALRLWLGSCDYTKDIMISSAALKMVHTNLAKYRVTFKQLLGMVHDYDPSTVIPMHGLSIIHKIALWQLENLESIVRQHYLDMEIHKAISEITRYVNQDLSAFYFETIKDPAYCGTLHDRTEVQVTCNIILFRLQQLLAPVLPLLVQETWEHTPAQIQAYHGLSPHQRTWAGMNTASESHGLPDVDRERLGHDFPLLKKVADSIKVAQEQARSAKRMGSSLQSFVIIQLKEGMDASIFERYENALEAIFVVSKVDLIVGPLPDHFALAEWSYKSPFNIGSDVMFAHVYSPQSTKCLRCWRYKAPSEAKEEEALCQRCSSVLEDLKEEKPDLFQE